MLTDSIAQFVKGAKESLNDFKRENESSVSPAVVDLFARIHKCESRWDYT